MKESPNRAIDGRSPRARVVRITTRLNVGGIARHVAWVTAGLTPAGFDTTLVAGRVPPGEDDMSDFVAAQGVQPLFLSEMSREINLRDIATVWKLYRLFVRVRPDIVHTHAGKAGAVGRAAGFLYRWLTPGTLIGRPRSCRVVHTFHGHTFHGYFGALKNKVLLSIEKALARLVTDRIVVISSQQYREIHQVYGVGREHQFRVVPLGLDLTPFREWQTRRPKQRERWGLGGRDLAVGIVGRLTEIKNHRLFLQVAHRMRSAWKDDQNRRVRFLVIGDGHLRASLEAESNRLGLNDSVVFLGNLTDPENFYAGLDVVALTSRNEGTPLTLIEGMANARPAISTDVGGVVDLLGPRRSGDASDRHAVHDRGVLVRPDDADAYCEALVALLRDESLREALGDKGRRFIHAQYGRDRLLADLTALYQELLGNPNPASDRILAMRAQVSNENFQGKASAACEF